MYIQCRIGERLRLAFYKFNRTDTKNLDALKSIAEGGLVSRPFGSCLIIAKEVGNR